jgi:uncharacterized protein YjbJ (UPF0337 family)
MWEEDDFEDNSKQISVVLEDNAGKLINDPGLEPQGKAGRFNG